MSTTDGVPLEQLQAETPRFRPLTTAERQAVYSRIRRNVGDCAQGVDPVEHAVLITDLVVKAKRVRL